MACSSMPKRGGKDQGEDNPKQACSCWFAHHSWLATSGASLYPPGAFWFADVVLSFWRYFFFFSFSSFLFFEAAALSSIVLRYACRPTATRSYLKTVCVLFCFVYFFSFLGRCRFSRVFYTIAGFLYVEYVVRFPSGWCFSTL